MAALGNDPRLAAMLVSAKNDDEGCYRGKNCRHSRRAAARRTGAIVTGRGVFAQSDQPCSNDSQQLLKRLNVRGGGQTVAGLIAPLLAGAFADRIARRRGQDGRYQLANGMGAMLDANDALSRHEWLIAPLPLAAGQRLRRMRGILLALAGRY
ncbi:hypothetical protein MJ391_05315 [Escherichia coli]|nr:hypothetical protein MJ391_05315 [Escherichia coli]